jgi:hypothetical protein
MAPVPADWRPIVTPLSPLHLDQGAPHNQVREGQSVFTLINTNQ